MVKRQKRESRQGATNSAG